MSKRDRHKAKIHGQAPLVAPKPLGAWAGRGLRVFGLVVAAELPTAFMEFGDCVIGPLSGPVWSPARAPDPSDESGEGAAGVMVFEPEIRFRARHGISTVVSADYDDATARKIAQDRFDRVASLLGVAQGMGQSPPLVRVVSVTPTTEFRTDANAKFENVTLVRANFHVMKIKAMTDGAVARFHELDRMATSEPHVATLIKLWAVAEHANRKRFSESDLDSCLVHYCKVVEQVAIATQPTNVVPDESTLEGVASELKRELAGDKPTDKRVKAIEAAARKLQEVKLLGTRRRLIRSMEILGSDPELRDSVVAVWDLRSRRAGHPSPRSVTPEQVDDARSTAGQLATGYFNWRWRRFDA